MPLIELIGITADIFNKFAQCLVILFKLNTFNEASWDTVEVRRRADALSVLDDWCDTIERIPSELDLADAEGDRRGLFYRSPKFLRAIKAIFASQMPSQGSSRLPESEERSVGGHSGEGGSAENVFADDFFMSLGGEPWLQDFYRPIRDNGFESLHWSPGAG